MKLIWSPFALERVGEIAEYITRSRPRAAEDWVRAIFRVSTAPGGIPHERAASAGIRSF